MVRNITVSQTTTNPPVHFCNVCIAVSVDKSNTSCTTCASHPIVINMPGAMSTVKKLKIAALILGLITLWVMIRALIF